MKIYVSLVALIAALLLACDLSSVAPTPTPTLAPTPVRGGIPVAINRTLPDTRIGQSGNSCGFIAADLKNQSVEGTFNIFPYQPNKQLRAVTDDGHYRATAELLNSSCQPSGSQYDVTADFGADYTATLGTIGKQTCVMHSEFTITALKLRGLPGPLNALGESLIKSSVPNLIIPYVEELVVRQLNQGQIPVSGVRCPGA
jgi:hypothetical protein